MTIPRRTVHLFATGVLLLILAWALPEPPEPVGNEAAVLGATASVWDEGDLRFDRQDMVRAERAWKGSVRGLRLVERPDLTGGATDGASGETAPVYATPFLYPVVAAPVYGLLGPRGLRVLDAALYLMVFWVAWNLLGHPKGCRRLPRSGLILTAFFFASAALAHSLTLTPTAFETAALFVGLALWCRVREGLLWGHREVLPLAIAGLLVAAAFAVEPALGIFALPPMIDLLWSRRFKAALAFTVTAVLAGALAVHAQQALTGPVEWTWGWGLATEARVYDGVLPFEAGPAPRAVQAGQSGPAIQPGQADRTVPAAAEPVRPTSLLRSLRDLVIGRHVGLVPYFPFAVFALVLYLVDLRRPGGRTRHLMAAALLVYLVAVATCLPEVATAPAAPGLAVLAAVYPLFLFLPWRLRAGPAVLLPFAAAGLWTAPALLISFQPRVPEAVLELPARGPTYRPLPLEVSLLINSRLPGFAAYELPAAKGQGVWLVPREVFFHTEPNPEGVWTRGASRAEVYVVVPASQAADGLPAIRFEARSIAAENVLTVEDADGRTVVRFDSEAKRRGTPVTVRPVPVARLEPTGEGETAHVLGRFTLTSSGGAVPAHVDPASNDPRYLGTFLAFE